MAGVMVLDASVLIALHNSQDPHHDWSLGVFHQTLDLQWQMPVLTLAEALVHPIKAGKGETFQKNIAGLEVVIQDIPSTAAIAIAELRVNTGLRMPDCVVLWQAIQTKAMLATTDRALAKKARELALEVFEPTV